MSGTLRIVCISDTHGRHDALEVPPGDVLIHAGDFTMGGGLGEVEAFDAFLGAQPHSHRVVIAGNHESCFQEHPEEARSRLKNAVYLQDTSVDIAGLKFHGSPWQPWFMDMAFNLPRGAKLRERWEAIPVDCDVLITHGPPQGRLDRTLGGQHVGCADLLAQIAVVCPQVHVFGHIHEAAGVLAEAETLFINACICDDAYQPVQPARVVDLQLPD